MAYREAYKGIDLKFYGDGRQLEYDIIVKPGADPNLVKFQYAGIKGLEVTPAGDLAIQLPDGGMLVQKKPVVYQEIAGTRVAREGKFKLQGDVAGHTYGFEVAAYDKQAPLVIDPVLVYSTFLGGATDALGYDGDDVGYGIQVDAAGCAYVMGLTSSTDFPTLPNYRLPSNKGGISPGPYAAVLFITKFNAAGNGLLYSTYLGGTDDTSYEFGYPVLNRLGLAVDAAGCAYVAGYTWAFDFPVYPNPGAAYTSRWPDYNYKDPSSAESFVTKLNAAGNDLVYSTYMRGEYNDSADAIAVDTQGNAYIAGYTDSGSANSSFANRSLNGTVFPKNPGTTFITKLNPTGTNFIWTRALLDSAGRSYNGSDGAFAIVCEPINASHSFSGGVWVTGETLDTYFPTVNPLMDSQGVVHNQLWGEISSFVTWLDLNGTIRFSTYWGGGSAIESTGDYTYGYGIARDAAGDIYVCGETNNTYFPVKNACQPTSGQTVDYGTNNSNAILFKISNRWSSNSSYQAPQVLYSTYLGGKGWGDSAYAVAADKYGNAYVTGLSRSVNFPVKNAIFTEQSLGGNIFVSKLGFNGSTMSLLYSTFIGYSAGGPDGGGLGITLDGKGSAFVTGNAAPSLPGFFPLVNPYQSTLQGGSDAFVTKLSDGGRAAGFFMNLLLE